MKVLSITVFLLLSILFIKGQEVLSNQTIVDLTLLGLDDEIILNKIQNTFNAFEMDTDNLISLKNSGVSNSVINSMMDASTNPDLVYSDPNDPFSNHVGGIYYFKNDLFTKLEFTSYSSGKTTGRLAQQMSYGFAKVKNEVTIGGRTSRQKFITINDLFLYAETSTESSFSGYDIASPNAFVCVKLNVQKNSRKLEVGSSNITGSESGISENQQIPFEFEEIKPGIYRVWFPKQLEVGEYAFMHSGHMSLSIGRGTHSSIQNRAFDFSITSD